MMRRLIAGAASNPFLRATVALTSGTAIAQVVTVAALPVLTRLYTPKDFELLAVYLALLGMLASIACLRFEIAIPIPENDADGADLLVAALGSAVLISALVLAVVLLLPEPIAKAMGVPRFAPFLWLVPLGVLMAGLYGAFQYWGSRKRRFGEVARSRLTQAAAGVGTQVGMGLAGWTPLGLLVGHMFYGGAGAMGLAVSAWRHDRAALSRITWSRIRKRIIEFYRFPTYSTLEALSNSAAIQLPVILIAASTSGPDAGFVFLAARVMGAPMQLIGSAISQVYLSRAPEDMRAGRLREVTFSILRPLALVSIPGFTLIAVVAPFAFALIFGEQWRRAGMLLQWMTPWFILQFLSSPLSLILHVTGRQRTAMMLHIFGLVLRAGAVMAAGAWAAHYVAEVYAVSGAIFYGVFVAIIWATAWSAQS